MQSFELYNHETQHTSNWSEVRFENNKVFQVTNNYRDIHNQEQLSRIIEELVITKGFIMNKQRDNIMTLENPTEPETLYWVWLEGSKFGITKRTKRLVGELDV